MHHLALTSVRVWCDSGVLEICHGSGALGLSRASKDLWGLSHGHRSISDAISPPEWEESWNFKAYISMCETSAIGVLDRVEGRAEPVQGQDPAITDLDAGDPGVEASRKAVAFNRNLH